MQTKQDEELQLFSSLWVSNVFCFMKNACLKTFWLDLVILNYQFELESEFSWKYSFKIAIYWVLNELCEWLDKFLAEFIGIFPTHEERQRASF